MMVTEKMHMVFVGMDDNRMFDVKVEGVTSPVGIYKDYHKEGDGIIWGMKRASVLKAEYTAQDILERDAYKALKPIKNGEIVMLGDTTDKENGGFYRVEVIGNYSNACLFHKVCDFEGNLV